MATDILQQVRQAVGNLNPQEIRNAAERPLAIRLVASTSSGYAAMERLFLPPCLSPKRYAESVRFLHRETERGAPAEFDLEIWEEGLERPVEAFQFTSAGPEDTIHQILTKREELGLPLARAFPAFRRAVTQRIVQMVSKENALFALATALPNIAPGLVQIPWGLAELGSDTAFLTVNQIRMLFLLGGASDRPVGYREQKSEVASVIAGAFGWRTLARELAGKIPLGGGLIPKAAIAYAGTYVVGRSAERLYRAGYGLTRAERQRVYQEALEHGKEIVRNVWKRGDRSRLAKGGSAGE